MFQLTYVVFQHTATYLQQASSTFSIFSPKAAEDSSMASLNLPTTEQTQLSIPTCSSPWPRWEPSARL